MLSLLLALFSFGAAAIGGEQVLVYDLRLDGATVGTREVTIRYLRTSAGEVRIIESYTDLRASIAGVSYAVKNRASAKVGAGAPGFTSSVDENGKVREIQGRLLPDHRWQITIAETGKIETWYLRPSEMQLSSLDLLDAQRSRNLWGAVGSPVAMLLVESGAVLTGPVASLGERTLKVGGVDVATNRYAWTSEAGASELAWTSDGVLVQYTTRLLGVPVSATLRELPPPPSFGEIEGFEPQGGALEEEPL